MSHYSEYEEDKVKPMFKSPPTETQLLQALAKMLPEKLKLIHNCVCNTEYECSNECYGVYWIDGEAIKPTEYLALCRMVEEGLTDMEYDNFARELVLVKRKYSASYSQRIQALAKVKGLEL